MSLRDYLSVCRDIYLSVGFNCQGLELKACYRRFADGRDGGMLSLRLYTSPTGLAGPMLVKAYAANKSKWPLVVKQSDFEQIISGRALVGIWPTTHIAGLVSPATTHFSFSDTYPVGFLYQNQLGGILMDNFLVEQKSRV